MAQRGCFASNYDVVVDDDDDYDDELVITTF
jgi:hypothetical protein